VIVAFVSPSDSWNPFPSKPGTTEVTVTTPNAEVAVTIPVKSDEALIAAAILVA